MLGERILQNCSQFCLSLYSIWDQRHLALYLIQKQFWKFTFINFDYDYVYIFSRLGAPGNQKCQIPQGWNCKAAISLLTWVLGIELLWKCYMYTQQLSHPLQSTQLLLFLLLLGNSIINWYIKVRVRGNILTNFRIRLGKQVLALILIMLYRWEGFCLR